MNIANMPVHQLCLSTPNTMISFNRILIIIIFVISCIPSTIFSVSFNLSKIMVRDPSVDPAGDAYISTVGIQLTPDEDSMTYKRGRATYSEALQLWEKGSGKLTDFSTHFSFLIDSNGNDSYGHGLAFFLAPLASTIQPWSSAGNLGIGRGASPLNSSSDEDSFVAVEFDTYQDVWDPSAPHVGININSMKSAVTVVWNNSVPMGKLNEAWISYNSTSKTLRVDFTGYYLGDKTQQGSLSYVVDLRDYLPQSVTFGFSASTGDLYEINTIMSWDFFSTLQKSNNNNNKKKAVIVGLGIGLPLLILASALSLHVLWKRRKKTNSEDSRSEDRNIFDCSIDNEFEEGAGPKRIPYNELAIATNNFAKENKLGEGGFGGVYRGMLRETNSYIAVKRVSQRSRQGIKEYVSEVKIISQLRHRNLVQLLGWCHQRRELLLVYEFMPNRSLDTHLFKDKPTASLSWGVRHKIALGLASALLYLHEEWERCVVHRDIKSSNIMLDSNFNAKLGDFGLARLVDHERGAQTTVLAGTLGYMAPESAVTGRASKESDVYSFGIVLMEIACGRRPIERFHPENQLVLVEWVWRLYGAGQLFDAADPKLEKEYDELEMEQLLVVGLWCAHPDSSRRPSIRQAIKVLNSEAEAAIPTLPPAMPVAMYSFPSMTQYSGDMLTTTSPTLTASSTGSMS